MLNELISQKKSSIVENWIQKFLDSYPSQGAKFLRSERDRFANPVGYTISDNAGKIFDEITGDNDSEKLKILIGDITRIRAVQNFSPSQAIESFLTLKEVVRGEIREELRETKLFDEFLELESKIDRMALIAFDLYMESREKLFQIRVNEVKARSLQAMAQNGGT